jgi:hypothetical protein
MNKNQIHFELLYINGRAEFAINTNNNLFNILMEFFIIGFFLLLISLYSSIKLRENLCIDIFYITNRFPNLRRKN